MNIITMKMLVTILTLLVMVQNYWIVCSIGRPYKQTLNYRINER